MIDAFWCTKKGIQSKKHGKPKRIWKGFNTLQRIFKFSAYSSLNLEKQTHWWPCFQIEWLIQLNVCLQYWYKTANVLSTIYIWQMMLTCTCFLYKNMIYRIIHVIFMIAFNCFAIILSLKRMKLQHCSYQVEKTNHDSTNSDIQTQTTWFRFAISISWIDTHNINWCCICFFFFCHLEQTNLISVQFCFDFSIIIQ